MANDKDYVTPYMLLKTKQEIKDDLGAEIKEIREDVVDLKIFQKTMLVELKSISNNTGELKVIMKDFSDEQKEQNATINSLTSKEKSKIETIKGVFPIIGIAVGALLASGGIIDTWGTALVNAIFRS